MMNAESNAVSETLGPSSTPLIRGVDVSQFNDVVSFADLRDGGVEMIYIRSSLGFSVVDSKFERYADGAREAGIPFGFYHFCTAATTAEAERQAEFFHETTASFTPELRYCMELDPSRDLSDDDFNSVAVAFLERIRALTGTVPIIYANASTAADRYDSRVSAYPLWVADWGVSAPRANGNWRYWVGWQYGASDNVEGVSDRVDTDYFTNEIRISETPSPSPAPLCGYRAYVVQSGDSLTDIADKLDTTVAVLTRVNGLEGDVIYAGQVLLYR